jgi:hypothetical protein
MYETHVIAITYFANENEGCQLTTSLFVLSGVLKSTSAGLPDFSWQNIPKRGRYTK